MAVVNIIGNSLTLAAIKATPSIWTNTNKILASLCVTQIVVGLNVTVAFLYSIVIYIPRRTCQYVLLDTFYQAWKRTPFKLSVNHLVIIGIDRYVAIVYPLIYEEKVTDGVVKWMICLTWLAGILLGMASVLWAANVDAVACKVSPDVVPVIYTLVSDLLYYFVVSFFLVVVYSKVLLVVRRHHAAIASEQTRMPSASGNSPIVSGDLQQRQRRQQLNQRRRQMKATFLTASVVGTFVILWFPYVLYLLLDAAGMASVIPVSLVNVAAAVGMAGFNCNWILYAVISKSFQRAYKRMFVRCKDSCASGA